MSGVLRLGNTGAGTGRSTLVAAASNDQTFSLPEAGGTLLTSNYSVPGGTITFDGSDINITNGDLNVNSGTLFVDEATGQVAIGTESPAPNFKFHVETTGANAALFEFIDNSTTTTTQTPGGIRIFNTDNTLNRISGFHFAHGGAGTAVAGIYQVTTNTTTTSASALGDLAIYTKPNGGSLMTEVARFTSEARFLNNTTTPLPLAINGNTIREATMYNSGVFAGNTHGGSLCLNTNNAGSKLWMRMGIQPNADNVIGTISFNAYDGVNYPEGVVLQAVASQDWADINNGCGLRISTVENANSTPVERFSIDHKGAAKLGTAGNLQVQSGGLESQVFGVLGNTTTLNLEENVPGFNARLIGSNTANQVIGYWFNHGGLNAGIASSRDQTSQWGTDLRFYTHKTTVADQFEVYERMRIRPEGYVGINFTSPNRYLHVRDDRGGFGCAAFENTNVGATGGTSIFSNYYGPNNASFLFLQFNADQGGTPEAVFTINGVGDAANKNNSYGPISSDRRLKQDITDISSQWNDVKAIRLTKFHYKDDPTGQIQIGPIAQELEEICPSLITRRPASKEEIDEQSNDLTEGDEVLSFKASVLQLKAFKALQEAMERIEALESEVSKLRLQSK